MVSRVKTYYSTFISGLLDPVQDALRAALPDAKVTLALDGLIAYETDAKPGVIAKLPFVTNSFEIILRFEGAPVREMAERVIAGQWAVETPPGTFRVIASVANQLVSLESGVMEAIEQRIAEKTRMRPNRAKPDHEFWLAERSEGYGFFARRLSHHQAYDKSLQKGELRPELANILCRLSDPAPTELFLDPFCGSGAIAIQRAKFFAPGLVIASDIDEGKVEALKDRIKELGLRKRMLVRRDDALKLGRYEDGSIHKIVTDPPWGHFLELPSKDFYRAMLTEFARILRPGGKLVILTTEELPGIEAFTLENRFNILVSGKKASVYVVRRKIER